MNFIFQAARVRRHLACPGHYSFAFDAIRRETIATCLLRFAQFHFFCSNAILGGVNEMLMVPLAKKDISV